MITPLTERQCKTIINNVVKVIKTGNIELLSKAGYNYLYLCSGFIAHYDRFGFMEKYRDTEYLRSYILQQQSMNQWRNFKPGQENYEYYSQKGRIYNAICEAIQESVHA